MHEGSNNHYNKEVIHKGRNKETTLSEITKTTPKDNNHNMQVLVQALM